MDSPTSRVGVVQRLWAIWAAGRTSPGEVIIRDSREGEGSIVLPRKGLYKDVETRTEAWGVQKSEWALAVAQPRLRSFS